MTPTSFPRHRAVLVAAVLLGLAGGVAVLLGRPAVGLVALLALAVLACALLLDVRRRQQLATRARAGLEARLEARIDSGLAALGQRLGTELGTVAAETRRSGEDTRRRVAELTEALGERSAAADETTHEMLRHLDYEPATEVQALLQLVPKVPGAPPLPPVGGWALTAASLLAIWDLVEARRPRTIVECGSGTSTLWLAYAARQVEGARVIALDHDAGYAAATRAVLERHGLSDIAEVRHAPLREVTVGDQSLTWYDADQLADVESIDLVLVDGPPKWTGPMARYPAVPVLRGRLAPGAVILADDAQRPDEKKAIRRWRSEYDVGSPERLSRDLVMLRCD